ncbi:MAG: response regulator transcription factor [Chloroflexi bacterium]|nr:response regulator transcription factor [Chloroflexota bacterium]
MLEKILVVDDEMSLRETLQYNLERQGYRVTTAATGLEALRLAREIKPDLILLDIMLPGIDGIEVCRILRREMQMPIIMVTARTEEVDRVVGLELGADDYISKPFSLRELMARVKAQLRRVKLSSSAQVDSVKTPLTSGDLTVDPVRHQVTLRGQVLELSPKEYELLAFLVQHPGQALTREAILERVWGWEYAGGTRTVDVHIRWLRTKIEVDPANPTRIVTVRNAGYRFEG